MDDDSEPIQNLKDAAVAARALAGSSDEIPAKNLVGSEPAAPADAAALRPIAHLTAANDNEATSA